MSIFLVVVAVYLAYVVFKVPGRILGGAGDSLSYSSNVATSTVTCPGVSQTVVATTTGRTSFIAQISPTATNTITLCKNPTCTLNGSGMNLVASSALARYEQQDGYVGPYSCISSTASTTIGVTQSQ